jgi:hypothetical protein
MLLMIVKRLGVVRMGKGNGKGNVMEVPARMALA